MKSVTETFGSMFWAMRNFLRRGLRISLFKDKKNTGSTKMLLANKNTPEERILEIGGQGVKTWGCIKLQLSCTHEDLTDIIRQLLDANENVVVVVTPLVKSVFGVEVFTPEQSPLTKDVLRRMLYESEIIFSFA